MPKLHAYILLDRSGSMKPRWEDVVGGIDTYVSNLAKDMPKAPVSLMTFDTGAMRSEIETVIDQQKAKDYQPFDSKDIHPRGMTPLFDAIGALSVKILSQKPKRAAITIMTDGMENASREYSKDVAAKIVEDWKSKGYQVDFVGCDFDATGQAASVGVSADMSVNMTDYAAGMDMMATRSTAYASTDTVTGFSDAERKRAAK